MSVKRTSAQLAWMQLYQDRTGYDPSMRLSELESGQIGFAEYAHVNIKWYETHTQNVLSEITRDVPSAPR